jgi:membrane-bound lytic murein transglycosylase D
MNRSLRQHALLLVLLPGLVACGGLRRPSNLEPAPIAEAAPLPGVVPADDPVSNLILESEARFREGERELQRGHVEGAREAFNNALGVLLDSSYGGRTDSRLRDHFDRLVDLISAYELRALAEGDGFTEQRLEPASIDELLAASASLATPTGSGLAAANRDPAVHDVPIVLNDRVLAFIELFQGRMHDFLAEGMRRGSQYLPMIQRVFAEEGLPLDLAYIPLVESAFKPNALSRARARGVWQFMSATAREHGLRQDWYVDERSDPEKATIAAARYLKTLWQMFDGDWHLALASYNGGPGRVERAMRRSRSTDFWALAGRRNVLPRETRDYVPAILAAIVIAKNPTQYGFTVDELPPLTYEQLMLPGPVDLRRIAEWGETTLGEIQAMNPELRRWTTPLSNPAYAIKVPVGTADLIRLRMEDAPSTELATLRWHTVKAGESLSSIARRLRVTRTDLAEANYLRTNARVNAGQRLVIPHEPDVLMVATAEAAAVVAAATENPARVDPAAAASVEPDRERIVYRVRRGDTLSSIARQFATTVAALRNWNGIRGSRIFANQHLVIFRGGAGD